MENISKQDNSSKSYCLGSIYTYNYSVSTASGGLLCLTDSQGDNFNNP